MSFLQLHKQDNPIPDGTSQSKTLSPATTARTSNSNENHGKGKHGKKKTRRRNVESQATQNHTKKEIKQVLLKEKNTLSSIKTYQNVLKILSLILHSQTAKVLNN